MLNILWNTILWNTILWNITFSIKQNPKKINAKKIKKCVDILPLSVYALYIDVLCTLHIRHIPGSRPTARPGREAGRED